MEEEYKEGTLGSKFVLNSVCNFHDPPVMFQS